MRTKLTNTVIAKLAVPEGKQSVKLFDTDVGGLGVRKMASGVSTFIFEMRPQGDDEMDRIPCGFHSVRVEVKLAPPLINLLPLPK